MLETQPAIQPLIPLTTVVNLTDAAAAKLRELTAEETNPDVGLRVYVYSGGCSGFRYGMMLEDAPTPEDRVLSSLAPLTKKPPVRPAASRSAHGRDQWEQPLGAPSSSAVRKLEPQPQAATAFGLLTVKPAPIRVST